MSAKDSLTRFSDRVDEYVKYRPGYPAQVVDILRSRCGLTPSSVVADVGSGPGNLARLFLDNGNEVFAIEPNPQMREAGKQLLGGRNGYRSMDGRAEATRLENASVDFVTAGQAFHWFDWPRAKAEFRRILRPAGWVVLLWNERLTDTTPFLREYEGLLLQYGTDYKDVRHERSYENISDFFGGKPDGAVLPNQQVVDFDGLRGRLLSSSYAPGIGNPKQQPMLHDLKNLFATHQRNGRVTIDYEVRMYFGHLE